MIWLACESSLWTRSIAFDEIDALLSLAGVEPRTAYCRLAACEDVLISRDPFLTLTLPTVAAAVAVASRAVLVRSCLRLWARAACGASSVHAAVNACSEACPGGCGMEGDCCPAASARVAFAGGTTWRMLVETHGASLSSTEQEAARAHFQDVLPHCGSRVRVKAAECALTLRLVLDFGGGVGSGVGGSFGDKEAPTVAGAPRDGRLCSAPVCAKAQRVFFGRDVVSQTARPLLVELALRRRMYIGPTTLAPEIALLMVNLGRVRGEDLVCDPFVGTGGILVAAARLTGCTVVGGDIDYRALRGKGGRSVVSNFSQYGLPPPELMYMDVARHGWSARPVFDAVLADPPYGIRAGARRGLSHDEAAGAAAAAAAAAGTPAASIAVGAEAVAEPAEAAPAGPIAASAAQRVSLCTGRAYEPGVWRTAIYDEADVLFDLLDRAAAALRLGGRLVYLYPALRTGHSRALLPAHPCLEVVSDGEEPLTGMLSRRVVCMVKVAPYEARARSEYRAFHDAAAARAGVLGRSVKSRLGDAYDAWFQKHGDAALATASSALPSIAQVSAPAPAQPHALQAEEAGTDAGAVDGDSSGGDDDSAADARHWAQVRKTVAAELGLSGKALVLHVRRLRRQMRRHQRHATPPSTPAAATLPAPAAGTQTT